LLLSFLLRDAVEASMSKIREQSRRRADRDRQSNFHSQSQNSAPCRFAWLGSQMRGENFVMFSVFIFIFKDLLDFG
jgi:hypothetical protein